MNVGLELRMEGGGCVGHSRMLIRSYPYYHRISVVRCGGEVDGGGSE